MHDELKVVLIQADLVWENPKQNRLNFSKKIDAISQDIDVIVLPEMFTTGFTTNASKVSETMTGKTVVWMQNIATQKNTAIVGSVIIEENNKFYNRLLFVEPSGEIHTYNKRHTFTLADEDKIYASGDKKLIVDYKGWKICPLICYDLRFPVWARNVENYDVLLYVANWPTPRVSAWDALLKARAIENMSYCIGVNRVGVDGFSIPYSGHSSIYDILGNLIALLKSNVEDVLIVTLEKKHIKAYRDKLKFLDDRDTFTLT